MSLVAPCAHANKSMRDDGSMCTDLKSYKERINSGLTDLTVSGTGSRATLCFILALSVSFVSFGTFLPPVGGNMYRFTAVFVQMTVFRCEYVNSLRIINVVGPQLDG